jgi:hypothetical protein
MYDPIKGKCQVREYCTDELSLNEYGKGLRVKNRKGLRRATRVYENVCGE